MKIKKDIKAKDMTRLKQLHKQLQWLHFGYIVTVGILEKELHIWLHTYTYRYM
jgi:hypothetical protein